mmetsp:Transcript_64832/g.179770  ORF Transcript_64832/g.179770 Transcript_64832/m.179770 type:complete len:255 (+) Transcript_64832:416-1180(+)
MRLRREQKKRDRKTKSLRRSSRKKRTLKKCIDASKTADVASDPSTCLPSNKASALRPLSSSFTNITTVVKMMAVPMNMSKRRSFTSAYTRARTDPGTKLSRSERSMSLSMRWERFLRLTGGSSVPAPSPAAARSSPPATVTVPLVVAATVASHGAAPGLPSPSLALQLLQLAAAPSWAMSAAAPREPLASLQARTTAAHNAWWCRSSQSSASARSALRCSSSTCRTFACSSAGSWSLPPSVALAKGAVMGTGVT